MIWFVFTFFQLISEFCQHNIVWKVLFVSNRQILFHHNFFSEISNNEDDLPGPTWGMSYKPLWNSHIVLRVVGCLVVSVVFVQLCSGDVSLMIFFLSQVSSEAIFEWREKVFKYNRIFFSQLFLPASNNLKDPQKVLHIPGKRSWPKIRLGEQEKETGKLVFCRSTNSFISQTLSTQFNEQMFYSPRGRTFLICHQPLGEK